MREPKNDTNVEPKGPNPATDTCTRTNDEQSGGKKNEDGARIDRMITIVLIPIVIVRDIKQNDVTDTEPNGIDPHRRRNEGIVHGVLVRVLLHEKSSNTLYLQVYFSIIGSAKKCS